MPTKQNLSALTINTPNPTTSVGEILKELEALGLSALHQLIIAIIELISNKLL
jgi:hypothetical protein